MDGLKWDKGLIIADLIKQSTGTGQPISMKLKITRDSKKTLSYYDLFQFHQPNLPTSALLRSLFRAAVVSTFPGTSPAITAGEHAFLLTKGFTIFICGRCPLYDMNFTISQSSGWPSTWHLNVPLLKWRNGALWNVKSSQWSGALQL